MMSRRCFHHSEFADANRLAALKAASSTRISVCIPTLDEAATIGPIVRAIRRDLMETALLVDEILVIDSGSRDETREVAAAAGAKVALAAEILPEAGNLPGKGENLWKSLHLATGDLICHVDGDISNFHPGFVLGLIGPLLENPGISYVKAYYERPLIHANGHFPTGGGRVSEILIRPLLSLFYPELSSIFQPLSGEYAARRELLETLAYPTGYGVEISHLIDLAAGGHLPGLAQTDLEQRHHRNREDTELGRMAFAILQVIFRRLERDGKLSLAAALPEVHRSWAFQGSEPIETLRHIPEPERPALVSTFF